MPPGPLAYHPGSDQPNLNLTDLRTTGVPCELLDFPLNQMLPPFVQQAPPPPSQAQQAPTPTPSTLPPPTLHVTGSGALNGNPVVPSSHLTGPYVSQPTLSFLPPPPNNLSYPSASPFPPGSTALNCINNVDDSGKQGVRYHGSPGILNMQSPLSASTQSSMPNFGKPLNFTRPLSPSNLILPVSVPCTSHLISHSPSPMSMPPKLGSTQYFSEYPNHTELPGLVAGPHNPQITMFGRQTVCAPSGYP